MRHRGSERPGRRALGTVTGFAGAVVYLVAAVSGGDTLRAESPLQARLNDYPTATRAEYVFACMAANGQSSDVLRRCSCSIDTIASIVPYEKYVEAETVLSMQLVGGERMSLFRTAASANKLVADLRRAQAEADILCF